MKKIQKSIDYFMTIKGDFIMKSFVSFTYHAPGVFERKKKHFEDNVLAERFVYSLIAQSVSALSNFEVEKYMQSEEEEFEKTMEFFFDTEEGYYLDLLIETPIKKRELNRLII
jgi:hypothetical protein